MNARRTLALRLAGPLQSWGTSSEFNRRDTDLVPSKSGIVGLLAAAQGRARGDDLADLVGLRLAVRVDAAGSVLRDYHTVSDFRGRPLPSAAVKKTGVQEPTRPAKATHVTERFYLQDAVFLAALEGPAPLVDGLVHAVQHPRFPLALGRRACAPTHPLIVPGTGGDTWSEPAATVLQAAPWQVPVSRRRALISRARRAATVSLPTTIEIGGDDEAGGASTVVDVPVSFAPTSRGFLPRLVTHGWAHVETGFETVDLPERADLAHDPFELLGWS